MGDKFKFVVTAPRDGDLNNIIKLLNNNRYTGVPEFGIHFRRDTLIQIVWEKRFLFFRFGRVCINRLDPDPEDTTVSPIQWELLFLNCGASDVTYIRTVFKQAGLSVSGISLLQ